MAVSKHAWLRSGEAKALVGSSDFQRWLDYRYPDALYRKRLDEDETIRIIQHYLRERNMKDPFEEMYQRQLMAMQAQAVNSYPAPKQVQAQMQKPQQYTPPKPAHQNPKLLLIRR